MIGLLHLPLLLMPGFLFVAVALLLRSRLRGWRLVLHGALVAAVVALAAAVTIEGLRWAGARRQWMFSCADVAGELVMLTLALRYLARLGWPVALGAGTVAAGVDWLVQYAWAIGMSSRPF